MRGLLGRLATRWKPAIFKGQKGQDRWVILEALPWLRRGFFLDLAAADGLTHSNTHVLEKWFGWRGICIEPQFFPAQDCDTRIQHELFSLDWS